MAALPNIGAALCKSSLIPLLAPRRKVYMMPTARVPLLTCSNCQYRLTQDLDAK